MNSTIQIAQNQYRSVDTNSLEVSGDIGLIDEFVPYTDPSMNLIKSGRRTVVINLNNLCSIDVDAKSSITAKSASSLSDVLKKINKE